MKVTNGGHRAGPLKQQNKSHKTGRHRSKSQINKERKGKTELQGITKKSKGQLSRLARKNRTNQIRALSRDEVMNKRKNLGLSTSPPFLVGVVSLCEGQNGESIRNVLAMCDNEATSSSCERGLMFLNVPRFKQRYSFMCPDSANVYDVLDCTKVCDTIVLLWPIDGYLSEDASQLITCMKAQGLPMHVNVVDASFSALVGKKKEAYRKSLTKSLERWSLDTKFFNVESPSDALVLLRQMGAGVRKLTNLQRYRPHLMAETIEILSSSAGQDATFRDIKITGYLRGPHLNVNSLVHVTGWGDFQMKSIEVHADPRPLTTNRKHVKDVEMSNASINVYQSDPASRESLASEVIPDPMQGEQTWPTEHDLDSVISDAQKQKAGVVKKVPVGTSTYQASWIIEEAESGSAKSTNSDDEDSDDDDENDILFEANNEDEDCLHAEEQDMDNESVAMTETDNTERYDVRFDEEAEKATLKRFREERENEMFPDEVDTPLDIPARTRFQRYRGLKSFRTSPWNPKENLPYDFARIYQFQDFRQTKKRVLKDSTTDEPQNGSYYMTIHIENVPMANIESMNPKSPIVLYGMLPHEQKISLVNVVLRKHESFALSIKSKDNLVFHVGYRRYAASPIFSQHTNGDKFKYERFMLPDVAVVASMYAPLIFPPASALVFKKDVKGRHKLVATGAVLDVNPNRVVVKRLILSGDAFKIHKRGCVVRHMFFNREDIEWFKPVELRTKFGRRGHIKEGVGTHGHMKCIFDRPVNSQDTVLVDLYKRVFPKWNYNPVVTKPVLDSMLGNRCTGTVDDDQMSDSVNDEIEMIMN